MILFPAIDLMGGRSVRLLRGAKDRATVYDPSPAQTVAMLEDSGCQWLHVVDLDGAFSGDSENAQAISDILDSVSIPIQLGGGIRDLATVEHWIEAESPESFSERPRLNRPGWWKRVAGASRTGSPSGSTPGMAWSQREAGSARLK